MALKAIPGYGSVPRNTGYLTYGGSTFALPKTKAPAGPTVPQMPGFTAPYVSPTITGGGGGGGAVGGGLGLATSPGRYQATLDEIMGTPISQAALGTLNTNKASWRRQLQSAIGNLVTQGGWDISGQLAKDPNLSQFAGDITPEVSAAAASNQLSDRAQIAQQYDRALSNLAYQQAAKGTLGSGAEATGATGLLEQSQLLTNQRQQSLLDALRGGVTSYLGQITSGEQGLQQTYADEAARLGQLPGATYTEDTGATTPTGPGRTILGTNIPSAANTVTQPTGVSWGGQTFTTRAALSKWLAARGQNYATWAANHPGAAARLG